MRVFAFLYSVFSVFSVFSHYKYFIYSNLIEYTIECTGVILVHSMPHSVAKCIPEGVQLRGAVLLDWVGLIGMVQIWQALPPSCRSCLK